MKKEEDVIDLSALDNQAVNGDVKPSLYGAFEPATDYQDLNVAQLREFAATMPDVCEVPISAEGGADASNFKAIVCEGQVIDVPTQRYDLIPHSVAFEPVIQYLESNKMYGNLKVSGSHNRQRATIHIMIDHPRFSLQDPTGKKIMFGVILKNSYNRSSSVSIGGASFRQWCSNGAVHPETLGMVRIPHVTSPQKKQRAAERVKDYIENMLHQIPAVRDAMNHARQIPLDPDLFQTLMSEYFTQKVTNQVCNVYDKCKQQTMFHAWLAATDSGVLYPSEIERQKALEDFEGFIIEPEAVKGNAERLLVELQSESR